MAYGSGATWSGADTSAESASVEFTATTSSSGDKGGELTGPPFTIGPHFTPPEAARAMAAALGLEPPNGARVGWPAGTVITSMSFSVNGGPSIPVPPMGPPVPVFGGLSIANTV